MLDNENPDVYLGGKGGQKEKKYMHFISASNYFPATWALLEDFEILDNFDRILTLLLSPFQPLKVGWPRCAKNLNRKYNYLTDRT